jgi:anti-sigma factor RsiW
MNGMTDDRSRSEHACVDAETIAAFVDGTIDAAGRARVVAHLATCDDCTDLVGEVEHTSAALRRVEPVLPVFPVLDDTTDRRRGKVLRMRRGGLAAVGGLVAIAASMLLLLNRGSALDPLVAAVGEERLIMARPTGGFHYGRLRSPLRGSTDATNYQLLAVVTRLQDRARQTNAAVDLHAAGVAQLLAGDTTNAIGSLQSSARLRPDDATFVADLGAAYLTRLVDRGDQDDAAAALDAFDRALARSPSLAEAWFNKALLLERMNRPADAVTAWNRYLELSDDRGWRDEATQNRDDLQRKLR